ncbi:MAG: DHA2 family efflux MFS transporter permease subunit [Gammaproteobacteria bacterium]
MSDDALAANAVPAPRAVSPEPRAGWLLLAAIAVSFMFAFDSVIGSVATTHMMGDTGATPDAITWNDIAFVFAALMGFVMTADLVRRRSRRTLLLIATLVLTLSSVAAVGISQLWWLILLRGVQGLSSGLLVATVQTLLFEKFSYAVQGLVQALFAFGVVMTPNSLGPALEGWITDNFDWSWSFLVIVPLAAIAAAAFIAIPAGPDTDRDRLKIDRVGVVLLSSVLLPLIYILERGDRYNWFGDSHIYWLSLLTAGLFGLFCWWQVHNRKRAHLINFSLFRDRAFAFGFAVSFLAGFVLSGSALLIGALSTSVLGYTAMDSGLLLLPAAITVGAGLLAAGVLIQFFEISPIKVVPLGLVLFIWAMWMFSHATPSMAAINLLPAVLMRGLGFGILFVGLTVYTFATLRGHKLAQGVGLFNAGRQMGVLIGIACLSRWFHVHVAQNYSYLMTNLSAYNPNFLQAEHHLTGALSAAISPAEASRQAAATLGQELMRQTAVLSLDDCFISVAAVIVCCAPFVIVLNIMLKRFAN